MSKSKIRTIVIILFALITFWVIVKYAIKSRSMLSPGLEKEKTNSTPVNTPTPIPTPKTFKFDSSTDLKAQLEQVNPQVLDSDFE